MPTRIWNASGPRANTFHLYLVVRKSTSRLAPSASILAHFASEEDVIVPYSVAKQAALLRFFERITHLDEQS